MTFSIRDLLALILLLALGMLAWRTSQQASREKARSVQLRNEIKALETKLRVDRPALHQALLRTEEEFEPLHAMRERSLLHFGLLRHKHRVMTPRGADVLSLRSVPSLPGKTMSAPVVFRLLIPENRSVWLKLAVHIARQSGHSSRSLDREGDFLIDSPFDVSGPFEMQLPTGDHTLSITTGSPQGGSLPLAIALDEKVILRASFVSARVIGTSSACLSAKSQIDFGPRQELPWLLTAEMNVPGPASNDRHAFSVWLSDRTSSFKEFPSE